MAQYHKIIRHPLSVEPQLQKLLLDWYILMYNVIRSLILMHQCLSSILLLWLVDVQLILTVLYSVR